MGYGVTSVWASQRGRASGAGSSKGKSTRTAKRRTSASARRAKKKSPSRKSQRRSLPASASLWKAAQLAGWTDRQSFEDWAGDPSHAHDVASLKARYAAYKESGR
jgi:hypothetical protein